MGPEILGAIMMAVKILIFRPPTLHGVPKDETLRMGHAETCSELKKIFADLVKQSKPLELPLDTVNLPHDGSLIPEAYAELGTVSNSHERSQPIVNLPHDASVIPEAMDAADTVSNNNECNQLVVNLPLDAWVIPDASREGDSVSNNQELNQPVVHPPHDGSVIPETSREADTVSNSHERRKPVVKIRVRQSAASSRAEDADNRIIEKSQAGHNDTDRGASSSVSVDAPQRNFTDTLSIGNQNLEDVNSCHDVGSRVTASIGSAKLASDGDELVKELQCTADSGKVSGLPPPDDQLSLRIMKEDYAETETHKYASLQRLTFTGSLAMENSHLRSKEKGKKKDKEKKRKRDDHKSNRDDPEYLERRRLKKEKKQKEKEISRLLSGEANASSSAVELQSKKEKAETKIPIQSGETKATLLELQSKRDETEIRLGMVSRTAKAPSAELHSKVEEPGTNVPTLQVKPSETSGSKVVIKRVDSGTNALEGNSHKLKIRIKNRTLSKS
ncbi:unnamed protein product [Ilex paraguariensis]|uniref:Uncharacterized protein n=1 Tax=Ilex paraguariensis TaxID=185542 RepID=A0ABC8RUL4_9AQUA